MLPVRSRPTVPEAPLPPELSLDREAKIERLAELMTAMRTEVHIVDTDNWLDKLKELAREKGWKRLLYGPGAPIGPAIETAWPSDTDGLPELVAYTEPVETFKEDLFQIDAGITSVRAGVADTGAVVLWPTPARTAADVPGAAGPRGGARCRHDLQFAGRDDGR